MQLRTLLRRLLRDLEWFSKLLSRRFYLEGFLEGVLQWVLMGKRVLRRVLRRGSKKVLSRRHLEGRNTPFPEYDPLGVCPKEGSMVGHLRFSLAGPKDHPVLKTLPHSIP